MRNAFNESLRDQVRAPHHHRDGFGHRLRGQGSASCAAEEHHVRCGRYDRRHQFWTSVLLYQVTLVDDCLAFDKAPFCKLKEDQIVVAVATDPHLIERNCSGHQRYPLNLLLLRTTDAWHNNRRARGAGQGKEFPTLHYVLPQY